MFSRDYSQLIWITDAEGQSEFFNQNWVDYTGLTSEQSFGYGWLAALHPDDMERAAQVWRDAVKKGTVYENEYRFKRANDNAYRWLLARGLPLKDEQGAVVKWFGTCTDIHEQKQILQERANLLELEQAARVKAENANKIKDNFLVVLSHELRTPLNAILGWSQLLQTRSFDQNKTSQALATIERNAKLQVQLIEDLLDVSRILQGKLSLNITNINLESIVLSVLETTRLAAAAKSIQLNTAFTSHLGKIAGDSTRLQQVVSNLLSNAVKFTPNNGKIEVQLQQNHRYIQIIVSDSGKGINPEFLPYIFDDFWQADSSSTRKYGGLGLGLAIVRHIVEMHGGTVSAVSAGDGQGTRFTVNLPRVENDYSYSTDEQNLSLTLADHSLSLVGIQMLIVDDDTDSRDFITLVLEQYGAQVLAVSSAFDALHALLQRKFDVLVSDISMPDMDGYMLIRQLRT